MPSEEINCEWLTPPWILEKLGPFDLDPCAPVNRPWPTASHHYTKEDDGLGLPWNGRVWCNPPYGDQAEKWIEKCAEHGNAIALIHTRTETEWYNEQVWPNGYGYLFIKGRITFYDSQGNPAKSNCASPSVLVAFNQDNADCLRTCGIEGAYFNRAVKISLEQ